MVPEKVTIVSPGKSPASTEGALTFPWRESPVLAISNVGVFTPLVERIPKIINQAVRKFYKYSRYCYIEFSSPFCIMKQL